MEGIYYEEHLRTVWVSRRRWRGWPHCPLQLPEEGKGRKEVLISAVFNDRTQGKGSQLHPERFRLDIRKHFFTKRAIKHCDRFPREVVEAPSPSVF